MQVGYAVMGVIQSAGTGPVWPRHTGWKFKKAYEQAGLLVNYQQPVLPCVHLVKLSDFVKKVCLHVQFAVASFSPCAQVL